MYRAITYIQPYNSSARVATSRSPSAKKSSSLRNKNKRGYATKQSIGSGCALSTISYRQNIAANQRRFESTHLRLAKQFTRQYCGEAENDKNAQHKNKDKTLGGKDPYKKPRTVDKLKNMMQGKDKEKERIIPAPEGEGVVAQSKRVEEILSLMKDCNFMELNSLATGLARLYGIPDPGKLMQQAIENNTSFQVGMAMGGAQPGAVPVGNMPQGAAAPAGGGAAPADSAKPDAGKDKAPPKRKKKNATFNLTLIKYEEKDKFPVLKAVRKVKKNQTFAQSKELTEGLPKLINSGIDKEDIEEFREEFAKIKDCVIEIKEDD